MDSLGGFGINDMSKTLRKRRTHLNRRPPNERESPQEYRNSTSLSSTPGDLVSDAPDDENGRFGDNTELKLSVMNETPGGDCHRDRNENKVKRLKLKVGGVTHTLRTTSSSNSSSVDGTSFATTYSDAISCKLTHQEESFSFRRKEDGLRGLPWKDFSATGFNFRKVTSTPDASEVSARQYLKHEESYYIKPPNKKYPSDEVSDEEDDEEILYLQKLKSSRGKKLQKMSLVMNRSSIKHAGDNDCSRSDKESNKSGSVRASADPDSEFIDEEDSLSDHAIEPVIKKPIRESINESGSSMTTRRKASQTGIDSSPSVLTALPIKQKEQLSEVEHQLKRAEAAQKRRMQREKADLESQAEAIRKILSQDSSRKKREDKIKKHHEALARERTLNASIIASNVVRWVIGPSGTIVTFPEDVGLPSIFGTTTFSYPPPREKCVGPSCTNAYKYRDSKSNLPLCSLLCYKAIQEKSQHLTAC